MLDLFDLLAGPIERARCQLQPARLPTRCWMGLPLRGPNEAEQTGSGFWNFGAFKRADYVEIIGSSGRIHLAVFDEAPLLLETDAGITTSDIPNPDPIQLHHVEIMIRHAAGERLHRSTGATAAWTEWVMDQIVRRRAQ